MRLTGEVPAIETASAEAAPAKINLALHVTGRRADGYHLIETLAVFTRLGDTVSVAPAQADALSLGGQFGAALPATSDNLVARARDALRAAFPEAARPPVAIHLVKRLPVASGIGGGSSDAAATLRALARLWRLDAEPARLASIGARLGADLPMCLAARPLLARGIGERLEPVATFPALPLVLANPRVPLATPAVFAALERRDNESLPALPSDRRPDALLGWLAAARNDLEPAAQRIAPAVSAVLEALRGTGAALARMSGSGATCFGVYASEAESDRAAAKLRAARPDWFVEATVSDAAKEDR